MERTVEELSTDELKDQLEAQSDYWPKDRDGSPICGHVSGPHESMMRKRFDNCMALVEAIKIELAKREAAVMKWA